MIRRVMFGAARGVAAGFLFGTFVAWSFRVLLDVPATPEAAAATSFVQWIGLVVGMYVGGLAAGMGDA